jgi:hypothetical protein
MRRHQHKTMWTLHYLRPGTTRHFETREACKLAAFECEGVTPVYIIPPLYGED